MYDKDDDESLDNLAEYFDLLSEDKEVKPVVFAQCLMSLPFAT